MQNRSVSAKPPLVATRAQASGKTFTKRKRVDSDTEKHGKGVNGAVDDDSRCDPTYCFDDADVAIRAEGTLFKIHAFMLKRDGSTFTALLSDSKASLQNPLFLADDTANDIRTLLWVLYALPDELSLHKNSGANITLLSTLAGMAQKYQFSRITSWTVRTLQQALLLPSGVLSSAPPAEVLVRTLAIPELRDAAIQHCCTRLLTGQLTESITLTLVDQVNDPRLTGAAYYAATLRMDASCRREQQQQAPDASPLKALFRCRGEEGAKLTKEQRTRLAYGHWSLVARCEQIRSFPPAFSCLECCEDKADHLKQWSEKWLRLSTARVGVAADLLKLVNDLANRMNEELGDFTGGCREGAISSLKRLMKEAEESLPVHFVEMEEEE